MKDSVFSIFNEDWDFSEFELNFTKEEVRLIYKIVVELAQKLMKEAGEREEKYRVTGAYLNLDLLSVAIHSALIDLSRMANFHLSKSFPDRFKYAGFLSYWCAKIRPIQLNENSTQNINSYLMNATLATMILRRFIAPSHQLEKRG